MYQISDSELDILRAIWSLGGRAMLQDILRYLEQQRTEQSANMATTLLSRLMQKGAVSADKQGRRNVYRALLTEQAYQADQTRALLDRVYGGQARQLLTTLVDTDVLDDADKAELLSWWKDKTGDTP